MDKLPPEILHRIFVLLDLQQRLVYLLLKNLPVLERLSLGSAGISLQTLESIHKDIPSIQDFILEYSYFEAGSLPLDITPATAITKFKYHRGRFANPENHITFHQYMAKKYINTTNVDYVIDLHGESNTEQIYLNGALDFFRVIRPDIGKFALHTLPDGINPFEVLNTGDSKIQELIFYPGKHFNHGFSFQNEILYYRARRDKMARVRHEKIKDLPILSIKSLTEKKVGSKQGF